MRWSAPSATCRCSNADRRPVALARREAHEDHRCEFPLLPSASSPPYPSPPRACWLNAAVLGYCWSPDGKRIAYTWRQVHEDEEDAERETESHLVVCDPDGKNQKTLATEKARTARLTTLAAVDWR